MTPNDANTDLMDVQLELANKRKMLKYYEKTSSTFKEKLSKLLVGEMEAEKRVDSLRKSEVVLLSEYNIVRQLHKSFSALIEKAKEELAESKATEAKISVEIADLERAERKLLALSNINNVLEFPRELRASEEED